MLQINLVQSTSSTLPFENGKQVRTICVSPDGRLLLSIDQDGRALLINRKRRALLHHFSFKAAVRAAKFSPDGKYVACAVGRLLQVRDGGIGLLPGHSGSQPYESGVGGGATRVPALAMCYKPGGGCVVLM